MTKPAQQPETPLSSLRLNSMQIYGFLILLNCIQQFKWELSLQGLWDRRRSSPNTLHFGISPAQLWRSLRCQISAAVGVMVKNERQSELHDASVPSATLNWTHTWLVFLLQVENIYNLIKQAYFIKYLPFSINCCSTQTFSHWWQSWHVCFSRRSCWFGLDDASLMKSCLFAKNVHKDCFPECGRNKQQKVISLLRIPTLLFK